MKNRYNKSLRYMQHHKLENILVKHDIAKMYFISMGITILLGYFAVPYHHYLKSFDFALSVVFTIYLAVLRPNIYKGKIKAYYRRKYSSLIRNIGRPYCLFAGISLGRLNMAALYVVLIDKKSINITSLMKDLYHPIITSMVIILSLLLLYSYFFYDRYTTIKDYSNEITYRRRELKMNREEAISDFIKSKDLEYDVQEYAGVYYDYDKVKMRSKLDNKANNNAKENEDTNIRRNIRI